MKAKCSNEINYTTYGLLGFSMFIYNRSLVMDLLIEHSNELSTFKQIYED